MSFEDELLAAGFSAVMGKKVMTQTQFDEYKSTPQGRNAVAKKLTVEETFQASYQRSYEEQDDEPIQTCSIRYQVFAHMPSGQQVCVTIYHCSTIADLKRVIARSSGIGIPAAEMRLTYHDKELSDNAKTLANYGITNNSNINVLLRLRGGSPEEILILDGSSLDPAYDYDFSQLNDDGTKYYRGPHQYYRPYGWMRRALKVKGKYDSDVWLGKLGTRTSTTPGEWSVSYHGTERDNVQGISDEGYLLSKGKRFMFGKGIYSTPMIAIAEEFAQTFKFRRECYKVVFQNRCNPDDIKFASNGQYWITTNQANIRPYGVCLKNISSSTTAQYGSQTDSWCTIQ